MHVAPWIFSMAVIEGHCCHCLWFLASVGLFWKVGMCYCLCLCHCYCLCLSHCLYHCLCHCLWFLAWIFGFSLERVGMYYCLCHCLWFLASVGLFWQVGMYYWAGEHNFRNLAPKAATRGKQMKTRSFSLNFVSFEGRHTNDTQSFGFSKSSHTFWLLSKSQDSVHTFRNPATKQEIF